MTFKSKVSRRDFLKFLAAGATTIAFGSVLGFSSPHVLRGRHPVPLSVPARSSGGERRGFRVGWISATDRFAGR